MGDEYENEGNSEEVSDVGCEHEGGVYACSNLDAGSASFG
jgi:hypothetical protein